MGWTKKTTAKLYTALEQNTKKDGWRLFISIIHNVYNENSCTLKTFHIFLRIQFKLVCYND
jgi:hypothetical protein